MREFLYMVILLFDSRPSFSERILYFLKTIGTLAPVAYLLDGLNLGLWFTTNQRFFSFILVCLFFNWLVGVVFHLKMKSFDFATMFLKNILMWFILGISYITLEMIRVTAEVGFIGESFGIAVQVSALLYPISKILKNLFILSNRKFPPAFIMDNIYNFEKYGDLKNLFNKKENL